MKKLMFTAAALAVAGSASAALTYDYKASVKHMYAKQVTVRDIANQNQTVYQKVVKSASLRGYLVLDDEGATSPTIVADTIANTPGTTAANGTPATLTLDHGRNRAFLVVQNKSAAVPKGVNANDFRTAKILPANLEVSFAESSFAFNRTTGLPNATTGLASGYLYVGGEAVAPVRPKVDLLFAGPTERGVLPAPAAATAGMAMIQDYVWTSYYLFGEYNSADFEGKTTVWYAAVQAAIDAGFEPGVSLNALAGWTGTWYYHDTWLNGAGFGKFARAKTADEICCGFQAEANAKVLETLSGNLKGGLYLCTPEGVYHAGAAANALNWSVFVSMSDWEDQWFAPAITDGSGTYGADTDQRDLWQDGSLELNTSDVISGTWSIKRRRNAPTAELTVAEVRRLTGNAALTAVDEDAIGLTDLLETLKGCALDLNNRTKFVALTGDAEIFSRVNKSSTHYDVPALTPAFAQYYGLANFK